MAAGDDVCDFVQLHSFSVSSIAPLDLWLVLPAFTKNRRPAAAGPAAGLYDGDLRLGPAAAPTRVAFYLKGDIRQDGFCLNGLKTV